MSIENTMQAIRYKKPGVVALEPVKIPELKNNEVLLRVLAAGLCQTDIHIRHDRLGVMPRDIILGHEVAGEIVECGSAVANWRVGDRVVVHPVLACHQCAACLAGRQNACHAGGRTYMPPTLGVSVDGGMAQYVAVPASAILSIGDLDPAFAAVLADAGLAPYHSVNLVKHRLVPGSCAAVIGVGGLGQFAVQMLRQLTAAQVIALDVSDAALKAVAGDVDLGLRADSASVNADILAFTQQRGVDVVIDLVGGDQTLRLASSIVSSYGAIQVIGLCGGTLPFEADQLSSVGMPWGVTLMKPYSGTYQDLAQVIAMAKVNRLHANIQRYAMADAVSAFDALECGGVCGRAVLIP